MRPASKTATDALRRASASAAESPVKPPPTMATSTREGGGPSAAPAKGGAVSSQYDSSFIATGGKDSEADERGQPRDVLDLAVAIGRIRRLVAARDEGLVADAEVVRGHEVVAQ